MENQNQPQGGFVVHVHSPGNQIIQTQNNTYNGPVYQGQWTSGSNGFSDEQIAKALSACVGKGRVIDYKQKWAGAYWYLRWVCNFPADSQKFCERINSLPFPTPLEIACDYDNIRRICTCSFMDYDVRNMEAVKVSKIDKDVFAWCREVALKLGEELGKAYFSVK
jgi:hypothetical protein